MTNKPAAFATYQDAWSGTVEAQLVAFRTKRKGETVTLYRWQHKGQGVGGFASGFKSPTAAVAAVARHAAFSGARIA